MNKSELRQLIREAIKENDPFYKSDSYLDDPKPSAKPQRLGPSSQFTFEPNDSKKDLMIHKIVDEYQDKIFDYLWNYELYKNEYLKENEEYPTSAPRVYVLMLGNRSRGTMGPYRVYVDKAAAEAEAARQEDSGRDTRAFVQDLAFIK